MELVEGLLEGEVAAALASPVDVKRWGEPAGGESQLVALSSEE